MKTKRQNHHRGWKQALSVLLVFALAAGLVLGVPALSGVAYAAPTLQDDDAEEPIPNTDSEPGQVNLGADCTVTVEFSKTMTGEEVTDLAKENTVADLYLIAPAVRLSGYDVYAYCVDNGMPYYSQVKDYLEKTPGWRTQTLTEAAPDGYVSTADAGATEWLMFRYAPDDPDHAPVDEQEGLAELLAKLFFAPEPAESTAQDAPKGLVEEINPTATPHIDAAATGLPAGLYLDVVHGDQLAPNDYAVLAQAADGAQEIVEKVCTIAYSDTKVYTFQPQLLSLPGRTDAAGNVQTDTTQDGAWAYNVTVTAKGEAVERFADLEIVKNLTAYGTPVSFVFHVAAYDPADMTNPVYERVIPLTFTAAGTMTSAVITGKIPVGSTVVITEEYGGAGYRFSAADVAVRWSDETAAGAAPGLVNAPTVNTGAHSVTITGIPAGSIHLTTPAGEENTLPDGTIETVTFTNTHDDTNNGGGAVVNSFTQGESDGWTWTQRSYNAQAGTWDITATALVTQTEGG